MQSTRAFDRFADQHAPPMAVVAPFLREALP
jgi:hypothetical protein